MISFHISNYLLSGLSTPVKHVFHMDTKICHTYKYYDGFEFVPWGFLSRFSQIYWLYYGQSNHIMGVFFNSFPDTSPHKENKATWKRHIPTFKCTCWEITPQTKPWPPYQQSELLKTQPSTMLRLLLFFAFGLSANLTSKAWNLLFPHPALRARRDFSFKWFLYDTYEDEWFMINDMIWHEWQTWMT
jgi:hypothetical protein